MANPFFGERWDAPIVENAWQAPTPVGELCRWCGMPVADGDKGLLLGHLKQDGSPGVVPCHRECLFADVSGHVYGVCTCSDEYDFDTPQGRRQAALALWRIVGNIA